MAAFVEPTGTEDQTYSSESLTRLRKAQHASCLRASRMHIMVAVRHPFRSLSRETMRNWAHHSARAALLAAFIGRASGGTGSTGSAPSPTPFTRSEIYTAIATNPY